MDIRIRNVLHSYEARLQELLQVSKEGGDLTQEQLIDLTGVLHSVDLSWFDKRDLAILLIKLPAQSPFTKNISWAVYSQIPDIPFYIGELAQTPEYRERSVQRLLEMYEMDTTGLHIGDPATSVLVYLLCHNIIQVQNPEVYDSLKQKENKIRAFLSTANFSARGSVKLFDRKNNNQLLLALTSAELSSEIKLNIHDPEWFQNTLQGIYQIFLEERDLEKKLRAHHVLIALYSEFSSKFEHNPEEIVLFILSCPYLAEWWKNVIKQSSWLFANNLGATLRGALLSGIFSSEITELFVDVAVFGDHNSALYQHLLMAIKQNELDLGVFESILSKKYPLQSEAVLDRLKKDQVKFDFGLPGEEYRVDSRINFIKQLASLRTRHLFYEEVEYFKGLGLEFSEKVLSALERRVRAKSVKKIRNWYGSLPEEFRPNAPGANLSDEEIIRLYIRFHLCLAGVKLLNTLEHPLYYHERLCLMVATRKIKTPEPVLTVILKFLSARELNLEEQLLIRFLGFELGLTNECFDRNFYADFIINMVKRRLVEYDIDAIRVKGDNYKILAQANEYFFVRVGNSVYLLDLKTQSLFPVVDSISGTFIFKLTEIKDANFQGFTNFLVAVCISESMSTACMITSEGSKPRIIRESFTGGFFDFYFVNPHGTGIEILGVRNQFADGTLLVKTITVPNDVNLQFTDIQNIHDFDPLRRRPSKNFMEWIEIKFRHEILYLHTTSGKLYTLDEIRQKARKTTRVAESIKSYELKIKFSTLAKEPKLSPRDIFQPTEAEFRQHPELLLDFCLVNSLTVFRSTSCPTIVTSPQDEVYMLLQTHQADSSEYFIVNFNNKNVGGSLRGNLQKNRLYKVNHLEASVEFEEMVGEKKAFLQIRLEGSDGVNRAVRVPVEIMGKTKAPYRVTILAEAVVVSSISDLSLEVWVSNHGVGRKNLGYPYADFIPIQLIKKEDKSYLLGVLLGNKTCLVCLEIEQQN